ncbi:MAG: MurR/RpiR family transcriptional regulator [Lysobacterales bacterium]
MDIPHNDELSKAIEIAWPDLTRSDKKIARVLVAAYPIACLETLAKLACRAEVSAPSVIRFIRKLGFDSYPEFQKVVQRQIHQSMNGYSRNAQESAAANTDKSDTPLAARPFLQSAAQCVAQLQQNELDDAVRALAGARDSVLCLGGRISQALAQVCQGHLMRMRPNVELVSTNPVERAERLLDVTRRDVVVLFDYQPYEVNSASFAKLASEKGATVILFTDDGTSPAARAADFLVSCTTPKLNEYGSMVPALAQLEILVRNITPLLQRNATARARGLARIPQLGGGYEPA